MIKYNCKNFGGEPFKERLKPTELKTSIFMAHPHGPATTSIKTCTILMSSSKHSSNCKLAECLYQKQQIWMSFGSVSLEQGKGLTNLSQRCWSEMEIMLGLICTALSSTKRSLWDGFVRLWKDRFSPTCPPAQDSEQFCVRCWWTALVRSLKQMSYFCRSNPETLDWIGSLAIGRLCSASKWSYNFTAG